METSQWLNSYYCNEHLLTALLQLQGQATLTGMFRVCVSLCVAPYEITKGLVDPVCPLHMSWILRDLCFDVF